MLSRDGQRNEERHRARLERARVRVRADTPHHTQTVRILLAEAGIKVKKSTEHEWAKVVTALEHDEVAETESAVAQWLTEDALVNGEARRGFDRAEATLRGSKKLKNAQRQRRQETEAKSVRPSSLPSRTALLSATSSRLTARNVQAASGFR